MVKTVTWSRRAHTYLDLSVWPCSCVTSFLPPLIFSQLCKELPPRIVGYSWQLTYSTSRHGASLKSLYRKLRATDSPVLVVIKDALEEVTKRNSMFPPILILDVVISFKKWLVLSLVTFLDQIFGAFLSHPLRLSETFYGTGETFLFMLHPRFKVSTQVLLVQPIWKISAKYFNSNFVVVKHKKLSSRKGMDNCVNHIFHNN